MESALPRRDLFVALRPVCDGGEKSLNLMLFFFFFPFLFFFFGGVGGKD